MQTQIVQIGNSLGLRLPKVILDSLSLGRATVLSIHTRGDSIVLKPVKAPRSTWAAAFALDPAADDESLWGDLPMSTVWED